MIKIYTKLFSELEHHNIFYCSWKSNDRLSEFLSGIDDLDLFVPLDSKGDFETILFELSFKRVDSYVASYPFVQHYIGFDEEINALVHLHVYFKIVTGESNTKNYVLPLDSWIQRNINEEREIKTLNHGSQLLVYLLRYFIKIGSFSGLLFYFRDRVKYKNEIDSIEKVSVNDFPEFLPKDVYEDMHNAFFQGNIFHRARVALRLKRSISKYKRMGFTQHAVYKIQNSVKRIYNKLFTKRKKILKEGILVAVCGLDGSGKSSAVVGLNDFYGNKFSTRLIHLGRPDPTLITLPFWLVFRIIERFKHSNKKESKTVEEYFPSCNVGIISALRYVILAYERNRMVNRGVKLRDKGYIVISDRYPTIHYGKMDSPRVLKKNNMNLIYSYLHKKEKELYSSIPPCDIALHLSVPVEVAIDRNRSRIKSGKETDNEIRARYLINSDVRFKTLNYRRINAVETIDVVRTNLIKTVWSQI